MGHEIAIRVQLEFAAIYMVALNAVIPAALLLEYASSVHRAVCGDVAGERECAEGVPAGESGESGRELHRVVVTRRLEVPTKNAI